MFFNQSKLLSAQILDLYDFLWPTVTAIWNLRWQVKGYIDVRSDTITNEELNARFSSDNKIIRGNLYRSCIDTSWDEHLEQYGRIILINLFAYYESWLKSVLELLNQYSVQVEKGLQFPSNFTSNKGIVPILNSLVPENPSIMENAFYNKYKLKKKYHFDKIEYFMICYRYFKELRNSIIHQGGIATMNYFEAQEAYKVLTRDQLVAKEKPKFHEVNEGENVKVDIRGIVGFSDIILKIVKTIDTELIRAEGSHNEFLARWRLKIGKVQLPYGRERERMMKHINNCNFLKPDDPEEIRSMLRDLNMIL